MAAATGSARVFGLAGETRGPQPIADYGLLADCNTAALVARDGSIDWFCLPRYDSGSVFGRILDPGAGHWSIRPAGSFTSKRRYLPGTLVIETTFVAETGTVTLTDALVFADGQRGTISVSTPRTNSSEASRASPARWRSRSSLRRAASTDSSARCSAGKATADAHSAVQTGSACGPASRSRSRT